MYNTNKHTSNFKLLGWGLIFGLILRLTYINIPIFEVVSSSQEKYAMIARNFYLHGFNILLPQFDYIDILFDKMFFEFHLFSFFVSLFYGVMGGAFEIAARLFAIFCAVCSGYFVYKLGSDLYGRRSGAFAAVFFFLSPLSIVYTRTFLPCALELFFLVGTMLFAYRWIWQEKKKYFWYAILFISVVFLLKYIYVILYVPILFIMKEKSRRINIKELSFLILPLLILFLWLKTRTNVYNLDNRALWDYLQNAFSYDTLMSSVFWIKLLERLGGIVLTPIGLFFLIRGLFINKDDLCMFAVVWFLTSFASIFLFNQLFLDEKQSYLSFLCVSSVFIGKEFAKVDIGFKRQKSKKFYLTLKIFFFITVITQIATAYTYSSSYAYIVDASDDLNKYALSNDKIIVTKRLYYYNRQGWLLDLHRDKKDKDIIDTFREYKKQGAKYFVVSDIYSYKRHKEFLNYILDTCEELVVSKGYRIYKVLKNEEEQ